ncbi:transglycosylase family protein [Candidatus Saccharibacteria bacterium]|nr:transglycosylase family protein [Candidatus Saccharibacteria bacterium]
MATKKKRIANTPLKKVQQNKLIAGVLVLLFVITGILIIYKSFAGSITIFHDNPDFWRDKIGYCESGGRYDRIGPSGHTGKYQYDVGTWRGAVGPDLAAQYPQAYLAPGDVQELAFTNTFARRGTQPWNASYHCWIKGTTVPASAEEQISSVFQAPAAVVVSPPAKPFGVTSGEYNVIINGRVTLNDAPLPNVTLATCSADRIATTDADGRFAFGVPVNNTFCLRPTGGIPAGARLTRTSNNVEHAADLTFENQIAGINCYRQFWCFLGGSYTWDRNRDTGYNFFYTSP